MTKLTCHAAGRGIKRIQEGDVTVGLIQRLADERWGLYTPEDKRMTYERFDRHQDAFKAFPAVLAAHNAKVQA